MFLFSCYVRGCDEDSIVSANHKLFGRVAACRSHNPIRHGYDRPLVSTALQFAALDVNGSKPGGGSKVLAVPVVPVIPPSDGDALALPASEPERSTMEQVIRQARRDRPAGTHTRNPAAWRPTIAPVKAGEDLF